MNGGENGVAAVFANQGRRLGRSISGLKEKIVIDLLASLVSLRSFIHCIANCFKQKKMSVVIHTHPKLNNVMAS